MVATTIMQRVMQLPDFECIGNIPIVPVTGVVETMYAETFDGCKCHDSVHLTAQMQYTGTTWKIKSGNERPK